MEVFLFPLVNATLFPQTTKSLSIFEPRYLAMIKDSVQNQKPIAVGFIEDASNILPVKPGEPVPFVRQIAGYGYAQIVEERLNGSLLIFLRGQGKLRLGKVIDRQTPYIVCEGQIITENPIVKPESKIKLDTLCRVLSRWIQTHVEDPMHRDIFMKNVTGPEEIVGNFASYMVRDYDFQQSILEYDDINDKIAVLHRLIESNELI